MNTVPVYFSELINLSTTKKVPYIVRFAENHDFCTAHRHNFVEFTYIVKGSGYETINNRSHELCPGTFSLVLPYQVHILDCNRQDPLSYFTGAITLDALFVSNEFWKGFPGLLLQSDESLPSGIQFTGGDMEKMNYICRDMIEAYNEKTVRGDLMFKTKLMEALLVFDKKRTDINKEPGMQDKIKTEPERSKGSMIWNIISYIQNHCCEHISLKELAQRFNTSPSYISILFQKHFGTRYTDFLSDVRIQNACALLVSTDMSIIDIAFESGFESYSNFSRIFRKTKWLTAQEYRKKYQYLP